MYRNNLIKILVLLLFIVTSSVTAQDYTEENLPAGKGIKEEIKEYINHHLLDSYDFSLFSYTNDAGEHVYIGAPLPVILIDGGLKVFSSSKFHHGETLAEVDGNYYKVFHNKIYKTDAAGTISLDEHEHPTNIKPIDFSITKNVTVIFLVGLLMFVIFSRMAKSYKKNGLMPTGFGRVLEPLVLFIRDDICLLYTSPSPRD